MKRIFFALAALLVVPAAAQGVFTVEGYLSGVEDGVVIKLGQGTIADTLKNGRFTLRGTVDGVTKMNLHSLGTPGFPASSLVLYVEAGKTIIVRGNDKMIGSWEAESDIPQQIERNKFNDAVRAAWRRDQELYRERLGLMDKLRPMYDSIEAGAANHNELIAAADALSAQIDSIWNLETEISAEMSRATVEALKRIDVSEVWLEKYEGQLQTMLRSDAPLNEQTLADAREIYARIPDAMLETPNGKKVAHTYGILVAENKIDDGRAVKVEMLPKVEVGGPVTDVDFFDLDGNVRHLSEFLGGYILLDFWAYWCGPCISAMPELREVVEQYKGRLTAVGISRDTEKQWRAASEEHGITWQNFNAAGNGDALWRAYGIKGIPHYVLIGPDGKVVEIWTGYRKGLIKEKLEGLL